MVVIVGYWCGVNVKYLIYVIVLFIIVVIINVVRVCIIVCSGLNFFKV